MRTLKGMRLVDVPLDVCGGSVHTLYLKAHGNDDGNTLFVGNVDYGTLILLLIPHSLLYSFDLSLIIQLLLILTLITIIKGGMMSYQDIDAYLKTLFSDFGKIESVSVSKVKQVGKDGNDNDELLPSDKAYNYRNENNENSRFAHVTFVKKSAVKSILAASDSVYYELAKQMALQWGIHKRLGLRSITECKAKSSQDTRKSLPYIEINTEDLQREVDSYMKDFDEQEQLQLLEQKKKQNIPDEDGTHSLTHSFIQSLT